ncbi:MAG: TPM domain-containing protein [Nitrospiraceae bacterium]
MAGTPKISVDFQAVEEIQEEGARVEAGEHVNLTAEDRERIRQAVQRAERRTTAEIVPMIVSRSGLYRDARHRAGLTLAVLALSSLLAIEVKWLPWGWHAANAGWLLLTVAIAYGLGHWAGTFPAVIRIFVSRERMAMKVRNRAELAFYQHGLHKTTGRTGLLILISLLEHRVQILADKAINERVPPGTWDAIVQSIIDGIHAARLTDAMCEAIVRCGELLAQACPARSADNPDELPDKLIQEP